jgi:dihydrodipicolinate synthase/N-acetylneuraminate lyase
MLGLPPYIMLNDAEFTSYVQSVVTSINNSSSSRTSGTSAAGESEELEGDKHGNLPCIPILLYNNVGRNGSQPSVKTLGSWFDQGWIGGIKAVGTPSKTLEATAQELVDTIPGMLVYTGSDAVYLKSRLSKNTPQPIYGLTSILGNIYPADVFDLVSELTSQDKESSQGVSDYALKQEALLSAVANSCLVNVSLPVGVKVACNELGINAGVCRAPLGCVTQEKIADIKASVNDYNQKVEEVRLLK